MVAALAVSSMLVGPGAQAQQGAVVAVGFEYIPGDQDLPAQTLVLPQGSKLEFVNAESFGVPHSLTSVAPGLFNSGTIATGSRNVAGVPALAPGTYPFYCLVHPFDMSGRLQIR
jgi:plastocyanin